MLWLVPLLSTACNYLPFAQSILHPPCSKMPTKPACTKDPSQVTPTFPRCVVPIEDYLNCRARPGMPPIPPGQQSIIPPWFDHGRGRRGQEVTSEYRLPWFYNLFSGLLVEMSMPDVLLPLLFNNKSRDGHSAARRQLATIMQGLLWTKEDPLPHSNWITSIQSVRNVHIDVRTRGYQAIESRGCIINASNYNDTKTNDKVWDAFERDLSKLLPGNKRHPHPPASTWPTCPDATSCGVCTTCKTCLSNNTCSSCESCTQCAWIPYNCNFANPKTFRCESCLTCSGEKECANCSNCTNYESCLNFTVPLYNQQALGFVIYNLVGFVVLWPTQIGIGACDGDLWALVHLWSGILAALGVQDDCNLLLHPDLGSARVYFRQIFDSYILPSLFKLDKATRFMMDNVFKGLAILTGTGFTPELLLCRFLRDFLKIRGQHVCGMLNLKDKLIDVTLTEAMIPEFMNNSAYRAFCNKGIEDVMWLDANYFFKNGECKNYERISKECFV